MSSLAIVDAFTQLSLNHRITSEKLLRLHGYLLSRDLNEVSASVLRDIIDFPCVIENGNIVPQSSKKSCRVAYKTTSECSSAADNTDIDEPQRKKKSQNNVQTEYRIPQQHKKTLNSVKAALERMKVALTQCADKLETHMSRIDAIEAAMNV